MADDAEEKTTEGKAKGSSPVKWIVIIVVGLAVIGGGGFFALRFFSQGDPEDAEAVVEEKKPKPAIMYSMESFIVNLLDHAGKRYLKVKLELEISDSTVAGELKKRDAQIRDAILLHLTSKKFTDLNLLSGKLQLRNELIFRINEILDSGKIRTIYFTEFVVQ